MAEPGMGSRLHGNDGIGAGMTEGCGNDGIAMGKGVEAPKWSGMVNIPARLPYMPHTLFGWGAA